MSSVGPVDFLDGRSGPDGAVHLDAVLGSATCSVRLVPSGTGTIVTVHDVLLKGSDPDSAPPAGGDPVDGVSVPVVAEQRADGLHVTATLASPEDAGWSQRTVGLDELKLAVGTQGLEDVGADIGTDHVGHEGTTCLLLSDAAPGRLAAAAVLLRLRPVTTGFDFEAALPWAPPPPTLGSVGSGGGYETSDIYDALQEAVADAVAMADAPIVEYGIVEHVFAFNEPMLYRDIYEVSGHIAVDQPMRFSMSGYLAQRLGQLSRWDRLRYVSGAGTGYWAYNHSVSHWGLLGGADGPVCSWSQFAEGILGRHAGDWPAAQLLWGAEPVLDRDWHSRQGPGETEWLDPDDIPMTTTSPGFAEFAGSFDAVAAFGADLGPMLERIRGQVVDLPEDLDLPRAMPKDVGMLRAILASVPPEAPMASAALERLRGVAG